MSRVALLGLLGIGVGQVAQTFGIAGTTAVQLAGLALAFGGIASVAFGQTGGGETTLIGAGLVLLSAVTVAFYYVWSVELTARHGTLPVAAWSTLAGFLVLLPFTLGEIAATPFTVEPEALAAAAYLGLLVTAGGLFLWLWLLRQVAAHIAASVQFLQPVFGVAASAAMFGDPVGGFFAIGAVLVLCGIALTMVQPKR